MGRGATRRCWRRCAARSCRRSRRTARCAAGSWTRPEWPRRARTRSAWPASIVASWARSRTVRSWSACRSPTRWRRCRSRRGSICQKPGPVIRRDAAGVPLDVTFRTKPSIALELIGRWPTACRPAWCWPTRFMARQPNSGAGSPAWDWITLWRRGPPPWCRPHAPGTGRAYGGVRKILCPCAR